jgi:hypothetical protein
MLTSVTPTHLLSELLGELDFVDMYAGLVKRIVEYVGEQCI